MHKRTDQVSRPKLQAYLEELAGSADGNPRKDWEAAVPEEAVLLASPGTRAPPLKHQIVFSLQTQGE
jgi:hypothetical protein